MVYAAEIFFTHGFIASVTEFHGWRKGGESMIDANEMFEWTAAVLCKPKVLFSYFGSQPDKFPASLVTPPTKHAGVLCLSLVISFCTELAYVLSIF